MKNEWISSLLGLFYPDLCLACSKNLPAERNYICISCQYKLPQTKYHLHKDNPLTERFWGRVGLYSAASLYHFSKSGRAQQLIHQLKYEGKQKVGVKLGQLYGSQLKVAPLFNSVDIILPVPLHPKKAHRRGYNQSALFAKGLSDTMQRPWLEGLSRIAYTTTQTKKSRLERFENVSQAFTVQKRKELEGKHLLLVDDVITTGATLEACAHKLLELSGVRLSMATIAIAS